MSGLCTSDSKTYILQMIERNHERFVLVLILKNTGFRGKKVYLRRMFKDMGGSLGFSCILRSEQNRVLRSFRATSPSTLDFLARIQSVLLKRFWYTFHFKRITIPSSLEHSDTLYVDCDASKGLPQFLALFSKC